MTDKEKVEEVLKMLGEGIPEGSHHLLWLIDQIARTLSDDYEQFVLDYEEGEDGPFTYEWDTGIPP